MTGTRTGAPARGVRRAASLAVSLSVAAIGCSAEPAPPAPGGAPDAGEPGRPNVVLIVMDTTRGDRCGFNGYDRPTTPRLDRLAREGTTFRDCWSPSPWTAPAHASLFTGLRPPRHGLTQENMHVARDEVLLAEILRDAGYRTGCFSSNAFVSPLFGLTQGFERFEPVYADENRGYPFAIETHRRALEWVAEARTTGAPYFLFVNDMEPHAPYTPPEPHRTAFAGDVDADTLSTARAFEHPQTVGYSVGAVSVDPPVLAAVSRLYDAEVATLDEHIGRLLDELRAMGALENTIVIVAGDHGESLGEHGLAEHAWSVHRTLLHVPLIISYPPRVAPGRRVDDTVRLEDVFPTVLELCDLPVPAGLDAASLLGDVRGRIARGAYGRPVGSLDTAARLFPASDVSRFDRSLRSVYDGRHHLIRGSDGQEELYDVRSDPLEEHDLRHGNEEGAGVADRLRPHLDP